jgi:phage shock protein PspC (stress-responsive transcriptional regulator)
VRVRTVDGVDLSAPPADSEPMYPNSVPTPPPPAPPDRIVGGVAALIARRLGLDPLWVRVAFVLLALAGGIGLVVYAGLWLVLIAGPRRGSRALRIAGGVVLVAGLPLILNAGDFEILTGSFAVMILLAGLALALWQPRQRSAPVTPVDPFGTTSVPIAHPQSASASTAADAAPLEIDRPEPAAPRPPSSPLGRSVLGLAIAVAAVGALIDQANGGRMHPEQWLGAAAATCGVGLLIAAFVGRGRWLVIPALLFAAVGYAGGHIARIGVPGDDIFANPSIYIYDGRPGGTARVATGIGTVDVYIDGVPTSTYTIDARAAIGKVNIDVANDVAVLVEPHAREGDVHVDGRVVDGPVRLGPDDGAPAVVIDARVGRGEVEIRTYDAMRPPFVELPELPLPERPERMIDPIAEAVGVTDDGWFVLVGGSAVIDSENEIVFGETFEEEPGVTVIVTPEGEFRLLPFGLLLTPWGETLDLDAIRSSRTDASSTTTPNTVVPTSAAPTTGAPTTAVPTTAAPTTAVPTTAVPTTEGTP